MRHKKWKSRKTLWIVERKMRKNDHIINFNQKKIIKKIEKET